MGIHFEGPGGYSALMQAVRSDPAMVYIVGEPKAVADVRTASPGIVPSEKGIVIGYRSGGISEGIDLPESLDECYQAGLRRFDECWPEYAGILATFFSFFNEWLRRDNANLMARGCRVYQGVMDAARGKCKVGVGDLNWGQPEITPQILQAMRPMLEQAEREGNYLVVHWYAPNGDPLFDPPNHGLRWTRLGHFPRLKVAVTEYAADAESIPHGEGFKRLLVEGDQLYAPYHDQVVGLCLYSLIGRADSRWARYNFESELGLYADHVASYRQVGSSLS
jgi:hypothetical protein